jgi:hypothetical protein
MTEKLDVKQWLEIRKEEAKRIDPQNAVVKWSYGKVLDPYGVLDLSPEQSCVGRVYWARARESDIWVSFYDLPQETCNALWEAHEREVASYPSGFDFLWARSETSSEE